MTATPARAFSPRPIADPVADGYSNRGYRPERRPKVSAWDILFGQWRYRREVGGTEPIRKVRAFYAQRPRPWRWKGARA